MRSDQGQILSLDLAYLVFRIRGSPCFQEKLHNFGSRGTHGIHECSVAVLFKHKSAVQIHARVIRKEEMKEEKKKETSK